jgi:hypothetical protein
MAFPHTIYGKFGDEKVTRTAQGAKKLGTRMELPDGRVFYYAKANGVIGAGKLVMQKDHTHSSHIKDLAVAAAAAVGATAINFTNAGAAIAADAFKDGLVFVNDVDGEGHAYVIRTNLAITTTATGNLTLEEDDSIAEALTTSSQIGLRTNKFLDCELYDNTDIDGIPLGVAPTEIADNEFFWCQTWGSAAVLTSGTVILGKLVLPKGTGATSDGAVRARATASALSTDKGFPQVGIVESVAATTEYSLIFLTIAR